MQLSFDQAMHGAQITVAVPTTGPCPTCDGSGARPGTSPKVCPRCGGRGIDSESQGFFSISQPCPECGGQGSVIDDPCPTCRGIRDHRGDQALPGEHPRRRPRRQPDPARRQGRGGLPRRPSGRPLCHHPGGAVAGLPSASGRQPRGRSAGDGQRGDPGCDRRGPHPERLEEDQDPPWDPARLDPAAARRRAAEAEGRRPAATSTTGSRSRSRRSSPTSSARRSRS